MHIHTLQTTSLPILSFARRVAADLVRRPGHIDAHRVHLHAAIEWLQRAHDRGEGGGVSYGYSVYGGWRPPYRETTGYIAETFFDLATVLERPEPRERALRMMDWLCRVQNADGSIANPKFTNRGIVFDTGMVLHGLVRAYQETQDEQIRRAAERAGDWLVRVADHEGRWTRNTHNGIPHVYNSRTAWALLRLNQLFPHPDRLRVSRANLDWAVSQEHRGWFDQNAFEAGAAPFTHNIAYAIRGLFESALLVDDATYLETATRAADAVLTRLRHDGYIPGQIDPQGRAAANYCCLTGNAQLSIIWSKLFTHTGHAKYKHAAVNALRYVMSCQDIDTTNLDLRGAIKGSQPIWGRYSPLTYPNWPTKFFIDALLLTREWIE